MSDEDDDKARQAARKLFSPDWAASAGKRMGEVIKASPVNGAAQAVARKLVDYGNWVKSAPAQGTLPKSFGTAQNAYYDKAYEEANRRQAQELELQAIKDKVRAVREAQQPQDLGDVDAPREPVMLQREFSNDQEKEAYLQRIRQAQANAGKK